VPFAIVGRDISGNLGIGFASASAHGEDWHVIAEVGVGLAALHRLGAPTDESLELLKSGLGPGDALSRLTVEPEVTGWQALLLDAAGRAAARSGRGCAAFFGHTMGTEHVSAGQGLVSPNVIGAMSLSFERSAGDALAERLLLALESGERAGGDRQGLKSAAIRVLRADQVAAVNLLVEDDPDPIGELRRKLTPHPNPPPQGGRG